MSGQKQRPLRRKHVPQRTCVVCREKDTKRELTRLVYSGDTGVLIDPTGKMNGRGAYICANPACWQKAVQTAILNHAFRVGLSAAEKTAVVEYAQSHQLLPQMSPLVAK